MKTLYQLLIFYFILNFYFFTYLFLPSYFLFIFSCYIFFSIILIIKHRDDNMESSERGNPILTLSHLFFSILKPIPFKKLNKAGRVRWIGKDEEILIPAPFTFFSIYFIFIFLLY